MSKSRLLGWLLITMIFLGWMQFNAYQEMKKKKNTPVVTDTIVVQEKETPEEEVEETPLALGSADLIEVDSVSAPVERSIRIETNRFIAVLETKGASLSSLRSKDFKDEKGETMELLPREKGGALGLKIGKKVLTDAVWTLDENTKDAYRVENGEFSLDFFYDDGNLGKVRRRFLFYPDSISFRHELKLPDELKTSLFWPSGLNETEPVPKGKGVGLYYSFFSEVVFDKGSSVERKKFKDPKEVYNESTGIIRWVGLRRKYLAVLFNYNQDTHHKVTAKPQIEGTDPSDFLHTYDLEITATDESEGEMNFDIVVLPLHYDEVKNYGQNYEKIIFSGYDWFLRADIWYVKLCGLILHLLKAFYSVIPNYGVAIVILTILVRLLLFPLTITQTKSMAKMQEHAPAIKEIRAKFKSTPQKMNQEIMQYYKRVGVNPLSGVTGCLPMFLQLPIFISLFNVLGRAMELKGAPFLFWIQDLSKPDIVSTAFQIPYVFPLGISLLPFLMAITLFFQTKMTITDPNQKAIVYIMPVMVFIFSVSFPSGLVVYWTVSNLFTIGQTKFMKRKKTGDLAVAVKKGPVAKQGAKKR